MTLRQTPAVNIIFDSNITVKINISISQRLSLTNAAAKTPKSIIKVKTPGAKRHTKSVAFASIESPLNRSPKLAAPVTPKPRGIQRRASTSGIPTERQYNMAEGNSSFLTPNFQQIANESSASSLRRSHRRLFGVVEQ